MSFSPQLETSENLAVFFFDSRATKRPSYLKAALNIAMFYLCIKICKNCQRYHLTFFYHTDHNSSLENRRFHKKCIKNLTQCKRHHIKLYGTSNFTNGLIQKKCRAANCTRRTTSRLIWFIYPSGHTSYIKGACHIYMTT